uniref:Uncharacterized protein n=1 Tax=Anopheles dirus TaxID=7168 RepID=A0A182N2T5_9DIPT
GDLPYLRSPLGIGDTRPRRHNLNHRLTCSCKMVLFTSTRAARTCSYRNFSTKHSTSRRTLNYDGNGDGTAAQRRSLLHRPCPQTTTEVQFLEDC